MRRVPLTCLACGIVVCLLLSGTGNRIYGQGNTQKVKFETPDGIELIGTWHPAKKTGPCVMILHPLGEDSSKSEWSNLAQRLQKAGYPVLTFDFRGHGNSTHISNPALFAQFNSPKMLDGPVMGNSIDFKHYSPKAYTYFVNDIATAKAFLDLQNDAGHCNSSSLVLIGADTGATLGAIWMNSEWYRFPFQQPNPFLRIKGGPDLMNPAGKNIMAAIWLSISPSLGNQGFVIPKILDRPVKKEATPTVFIYNENSKLEEGLAKGSVEKLKVEKSEKHKYIAAVPVKAPANLSGRSLLGTALKTDENIVKALKTLEEDARGNSWVEHDFKRSSYVWWLGGGNPIPATPQFAGKNFNFFNFSYFAPTR